MTAPRIEVALCTYNGERFLGDQLRSIEKQSRLPDRVVICDDASNDDTLALVAAFAERAEFPVEVQPSSSRLGVRANFNRAISLCNGDLVVLSDQDDVWLEDRLERTEAAFEDPRILAIFADANLVDEDLRPSGGRLWDAVFFTARDRRRMHQGAAAEVLLKKEVATGATMAFRSSMTPWVIPVPAPWVHDAWIALLAAGQGGLAFIDRPLIAYRRHASNEIGLPVRSMVGRARLYGRSLDSHLAAVAEGYEAVHHRLNRMPRTPERDLVLSMIADKIDHLRVRRNLRGRGPTRIFGVIRELGAGRYGRYGRGFFTALHDLLPLGGLDKEQAS